MKKQKEKDYTKDEISNILSTYLTEYEVMRSELLQVQGAQGQLVLYSLLAVGVAIPIVASLLQNQAWVSLLIAPMVFSSMAWTYTGYVGMSYRISIYIHTHLRPSIKSLLEQKSSHAIEVIAWEQFARSKGLNVLAIPKGFELLLFIIPSIGSVVLYFIIRDTLGFRISAGDWILISIDIFLTIGVLIMAFIIMRVGYSKLIEHDED